MIGKAKLIAPLHTDSPALACREKHRHVHEFKQRIAAAEVEARRRTKQPADPLVSEALTWRQAIEDARAQDDAAAPGVAEIGEEIGAEYPRSHEGAADHAATALRRRPKIIASDRHSR